MACLQPSFITLALVASLFTLPALTASKADPATNGIAWFVQISDLHVSKYNKSPIEADLATFAQQVLHRLRPAKILLTGDLVDSKTRHGGSQQHHSEWQGYQVAWQRLAAAAGLKAKDILDVRGNHDVFDIIRGSSADWFLQHSARVAARKGSGTVRAYIDLLTPQVELSGGKQPQEPSCPSALLVGMDLTPDVGMRGPTNFMGVVTNDAADEMERSLIQAVGSVRTKGCNPPIIAYSHHPLSTLSFPDQPRGSPNHIIHTMFSKYDVAAFLCGHLHDAFGQRLHRLHQKRNGAFMAELETADWKHARRFRVLAVDDGVVTFTDLRFLVSSERDTAEILPVDDTMRLSSHMVLITSPPPALYAPLTSSQLSTQYSVIRCLVLPVPGSFTIDQKAQPQSGLALVQLHWRCGEKTGIVPMKKVSEQAYEVGVPAAVQSCSGNVEIQVVSTDQQGQDSTSERRTVSLTPNIEDSAFDHNSQFSWMEQLMLGMYWPEFGRQLFLSLWTFHLVAMLLVPRLLSGPILLAQSALQHGYNSSTPVFGSSALLVLTMKLVLKLLVGSGRLVLGWVLWPLQALARLALMRDLWLYVVAFNLNLLLGPWYCARFTSNLPSGFLTSYGLYIPPDVSPPSSAPSSAPPPSSLAFEPSPDVNIITVVHTASCILPATMWLAAVIAYWSDAVSAGKVTTCSLLSWAHIVTLLPILWLHYKMLLRMWCTYGGLSIAMSPAIGWVVPLSLLLLVQARRRLTKRHTS